MRQHTQGASTTEIATVSTSPVSIILIYFFNFVTLAPATNFCLFCVASISDVIFNTAAHQQFQNVTIITLI
jgi:hypothetical protein